jgi:cation:H+ antiporter
MITTGLLIVSLLVVLYAAHLFTNGVEWLGKQLGFSHGLIGSVLAGVGTALPETIIPIIAILFHSGEQSFQDVGVGAILGAPFMLTTLTLPLVGAAVWALAAAGRRDATLRIVPHFVQLDLGYFLIGYGLAVMAALMPVAELRYLIAVVLVGLYGHYLWRLQRLDRQHAADRAADEDELLPPLIFSRRTPAPALGPILVQIAVGLGGIIGGAHLFVEAVNEAAAALAIPPLLLSLLITPVATELPEKFNSLIWIFQRKDALAVANITGAMVFQSTFPVAVGLVGTAWQLNWHGWTTALFALAAAGWYLAWLRRRRAWRPWQLVAGALLYIGFGLALVIF